MGSGPKTAQARTGFSGACSRDTNGLWLRWNFALVLRVTAKGRATAPVVPQEIDRADQSTDQ